MRGMAHTRKWLARALLVAGATLPSLGCGDDDKPGTGPVASGLPADKPVGTLTSAEATQLCKAVDSSLSDAVISDSLCKFVAVFGVSVEAAVMPSATDAMLQASCTTGFNQCKASPSSTGDACKPAPASCTATVGEVEKCLGDMKAAVAALGASVPACNTLTRASLNSPSGGAGALKEPESCAALERKCPDLVPDPVQAD